MKNKGSNHVCTRLDSCFNCDCNDFRPDTGCLESRWCQTYTIDKVNWSSRPVSSVILVS